MAWSCKGTYFESCNCEAACPCVFLSPPTEGECTVLIGWHIDQGADGAVALDGLNVAFAVHAPGTMHQTRWQVAIYLDGRATEQQRGALLRIFGGQAGGHPAVLASFVGEVLGVASVPITFEAAGKSYSLEIPAIASVAIEPIEGPAGPVQIQGHPLCIAPGFPATVARSKRLRYTDHGKSWSLSGRNGLFSPFAYQG